MPVDLVRLESLAAELEAFLVDFERQVQAGPQEILTELQIQLTTKLDALLQQLAATEVWGAGNQLPSSVLWNRCRSWLETGWLQTQARLKPRGYAGDFELLSRIWNRELTTHPLGRYFDAYFQAQGAPEAVRQRMQLVAAWLVEQVVSKTVPQPTGSLPAVTKVVSVGCGPGLDILAGLRQLSPAQLQHVQVTLLDLDPQAIQFAQQQFSAAQLALPQPPQLIQANLFRLPKKPAFSAPLAGADLLVCTGLFDYLDDSAATQMLATFWERLAPGGRLVVFHFDPSNPTRAYMEWFGNWYLIYRTRADLGRLAAAAGIPPQGLVLGAEPRGINVFVSAVKPYGEKVCDLSEA